MSTEVFGVDSRLAYTALIAVISIQRLWELGLSRRHLVALKSRGAIEVGAGHYPWMVVLHATFLCSCLAEVWFLDRPWLRVVAAPALLILCCAFALRWWTLKTLGQRWTTRVLVVPGEELVGAGPYRWLRHPNYVAVVLEIAAIPLVHSVWLTAVVFSIANLVLLRERVRVEEGALNRLVAGGAG
jgi:methyltransferase